MHGSQLHSPVGSPVLSFPHFCPLNQRLIDLNPSVRRIFVTSQRRGCTTQADPRVQVRCRHMCKKHAESQLGCKPGPVGERADEATSASARQLFRLRLRRLVRHKHRPARRKSSLGRHRYCRTMNRFRGLSLRRSSPTLSRGWRWMCNR